ncbi:hypothetical protein JZO66_11485 [Enterococcus sp. DIV0242_7C1]|uniref:Gram-positive cocci surface proteins LPxTG domain-containing protein n=1 Tax=Candidatus Enterococcus dunnyi TaxID=1834192 RepID=A0A200IVN0_9ENTE|nr:MULTISPECIES: hypothetical protein [unclassified Enterococcus]MBO0471168.1 hypothetical protein [Enterococcus sp. DIV0242_7C1]OUZ28440.1 hypothetical protein A5889_003195 [Enterococcus sp. 9D6_DIV0238]
MKNQHRGKGKLLIGLILIFSLLIAFKPVEARGESALPSGMVVGDDQGIKVNSDGKYLIDIRDVAPGKKWSTKITIINVEKDIPYQLTMTSSKPTLIEGNLDLSKAIQMSLFLDGKEVYQGPLSGVSKARNLQDKANPLNLGIYKGGDTHLLEAKFELDGKSYTNRDFFKKNVVENIWNFKAVKTELPDTKGPDKPKNIIDTVKDRLSFPKTGEQWREALLFMCIGLFLILIVLLILKHKKNEQGKKNKKWIS